MPRLPHLALLATLTLGPGCEVIDMVRGFAAAAGELGEHLEGDLAAELTDAKIDKIIEVTPLLVEFTKTAKHKWEPDPDAPDFSKLASALGGLGDYIAFFEGHGTRMTEYYVDLIKIADARALVTMNRAYAEAKAKHKTERDELQAKLGAAAEADKAAIQSQLDINAKATETLDEQYQAGVKARAARNTGGKSYSLSEAEIARVEARLPELEKVLEASRKK